MFPIVEADEESSASSLGNDDNADNSDFCCTSSSEVNSMISHASTSYSSMSANSAPLMAHPPSALRRGKYTRAHYPSRETQSDCAGSPNNSPRKKKKKSKKHKKDKTKKSKKVRTQEVVAPPQHQLVSNINISAVEQARPSGPKSAISSSVPSSNGSDSNAGPPLPLPKESTLVIETEKVKEEGFIMARGSRWAIIMKKWSSDCYWVRHNRTELLVFNTYDDFKRWERCNDEGDKVGAEKFIKFSFDFNTKKKKMEHMAGIDLPVSVKKYWMGNVKPKRYAGFGGHLHQFKIEKSTHSGTNVVAAFASTSPRELNVIRKIIKRCMKRGGSKDRSIKLSTRDKKNNQAKVISDQSKVPPKSQGRLITTMYDFDIDDGTDSLVSGVSSARGGGSIKFSRKMRHNPAGIIT